MLHEFLLRVWTVSALCLGGPGLLEVEDTNHGDGRAAAVGGDLGERVRALRASADALRGEDVAALRPTLAELVESASATTELEVLELLDGLCGELGMRRERVATRATIVERLRRERDADDAELLVWENRWGGALVLAGEPEAARSVLEDVVARRERAADLDLVELAKARGNLALAHSRLGDPERARDLEQGVLEAFERALGPEHHNTLVAAFNLAHRHDALGDHDRAFDLHRRVLEGRLASSGAGHPLTALARLALADAERRRGEIGPALERAELAVLELAATLPPTHPELVEARMLRSGLLVDRGRLEDGLAAWRSVVEALETSSEPDSEQLARARLGLGGALVGAGLSAEAEPPLRAAVAVLDPRLGPDHLDALRARGNLATCLRSAGRLLEAAQLQLGVLEGLRRTRTAPDADLAQAEQNRAAILDQLGDRLGALEHAEAAVDGFERTLGPDHLRTIGALQALAQIWSNLEEPAAAATVLEDVSSRLERSPSIGAEHPARIGAAVALGQALVSAGRFDDATAVLAAARDEHVHRLGRDHPWVLYTGLVLGSALAAGGEADRGAALATEAVEHARRVFAPDDPWRSRVEVQAAFLLATAAPGPTALDRQARAVDQLERLVGAGDGDVVAARRALVDRLLTAGEDQAARSAAARWLECSITRLELAAAMAPRESRAIAAQASALLPEFLAVAGDEPAAIEGIVTWIETRRALAHPQPRPLDADERAARERVVALSALVAEAARSVPAPGEDRAEVVAAARERDRALRSSRQLGRVRPRDVADALAPGAIAVGFVRIEAIPLAPSARYAAALIEPTGTVRWIELGEAEAIDRAVLDWRNAVGRPVAPRQDGAERPTLVEAGRRLRASVVDPVLLAATAPGAVRSVHLCVDGSLELVPFDALPTDRPGELLGDAVEIRHLLAFDRLVRPSTSREAAGLTLVGDLEFDALVRSTPGAPRSLAAGRTPGPAPEGASDVTPPVRFDSLPGSGRELDELAALWDAAGLPGRSDIRRGATVDRASFVDAVRGARFVHVASHGWSEPTDDLRATWAPLALTGLALSGANVDREGLITAETVARLDLAGCELFVLAACDTASGLAQGGLGTRSLRSALHEAGVGTSLTALWPVDDEASAALMSAFYRRLWLDGRPAAEALWDAKRSLFDRGVPHASWAGWILTAEPGGGGDRRGDAAQRRGAGTADPR